jgi:hypothetical protein
MQKHLERIDEAARQYNKTKNPELKKLWYKLVKEFADSGLNSSKRRVVSVDSCNKRDDGTYIVIGRSRLL